MAAAQYLSLLSIVVQCTGLAAAAGAGLGWTQQQGSAGAFWPGLGGASRGGREGGGGITPAGPWEYGREVKRALTFKYC